ncbi:MAG: hypothetical protein HN639_04940, partial [Candidatus Thioglobus sp.]|nr:hypothetical protein [Candidatus Thioglobus sp.]MBT7498881.1 hypothetical protein [Candidatus Thioglobus sp.]
MKKILIYLLAVVIVVVLAVVFFFDGLTKSALESYAQKVLKTPVSIAEFRSDLSDRKINLDFIEVKNPETFKNENA